MARLASLPLLPVLLLSLACSSSEPDDRVAIDRDVTLDVIATGGFDDFGSAGAALGYAVDTRNGFALVAALKFTLPTAHVSFTPGDAAAAASAYRPAGDGDPVPPGVDVETHPMLFRALASTAAIRTMSGSERAATVILLAGDPATPTPSAIYVADAGSLALTRAEGPHDILEGVDVRFREVTGLGEGAALVDGGEVLRIPAFYFDWPTPGTEP